MSKLLVLKLCVECGVIKDVPAKQERCDVCDSELSEVQLKPVEEEA